MSLPIIPLPTNTVTVGGAEVTFRALSRREAMRLMTEFQGRPDDAEAFLVSCGCGVSIEEANEWRENTDPILAGKVIDGIVLLTGLSKDAEGNDPNSSGSGPS